MQAVDERPALLELFAGGGGTTTGATAAGWDVFAVEWDAAACAVHGAMLDSPIWCGDVRAVADYLPALVAWLCGRRLHVWASPPCQAWSSAGKRLGAADERNGWPWVWDVVDALRDAGIEVVTLATENVGGMLHHLSRAECDHGARPNPDACPGCYWTHAVLPEARRRFACVDVRVLDAVDYGVPQHRERLIMACGSTPYRWPAPTHHPIGSMFRPWWRTVRDALGHPGHVRAEQTGAVARSTDEPAPTTGTGGTMYLHDVDPGTRGSRAIPDTPKHPAWQPDAPAGTVRAMDGGQYIGADAPCTTVTATEGRGCATDTRRASRTIGRRITPDEAALLQAWPEVIPHLTTARTAEDRYRIVGNAVPPPLARAVLARLRGAA